MATIYNPKKKFMFVHVHKCAGTSITGTLLNQNTINLAPEGWEIAKHNPNAKNIMSANNVVLKSNYKNPIHARALDLQEMLGMSEFEKYYKFAIVRNPWKRLTSWYFFLRQSPKKEQYELVRKLTLEDFIKFSIDHFYLPQYKWLVNQNEEIIVDDVIKLADLDSRWDDIVARYTDKKLDLKVANTSTNTTKKRTNPFETVRHSTLDAFRKAYAKDFELLGFDNAIPESREQNSKYENCEKVWTEEINGKDNIEELCKKFKVNPDIYALYRESNSGFAYINLIKQKGKTKDSIKSETAQGRIKSLHERNQKLAREVKRLKGK